MLNQNLNQNATSAGRLRDDFGQNWSAWPGDGLGGEARLSHVDQR